MKKNLALMTAAVALLASPLLLPSAATALELIDFAQPTGSPAGFSSTAVTATSSSLSITGQTVDVDFLLGVVPPGAIFAATMNLTATSLGAATVTAGVLTQPFSGSFSIIGPAADCGATGNCLSGTFSDIVAGQTGGAALTLSTATSPSGSVSFTSSIIPAVDLATLQAFSLSISNFTPPVSGTNGGTLGTSSGTFTGTASAAPNVPEPASLTLLGSALVGMGWLARRRRKSL